MKPENLNEILQSNEYDFLRNDKNLNDNIILLVLGGSYAYGTNVEDSDVDIRGIAMNSPEEILSNNIRFEQIVEVNTDTTIYGICKFFNLLKKSNPNILEILGCREEEQIYVHPIARKILDNQSLFLSKQVAYTCAGYADSQLNRFLNKNARFQSQEEREKRILFSLDKSMKNLANMTGIDVKDIKMYVDDVKNRDYILENETINEEFVKEVCIDLNLKQYPVRDLAKVLKMVRQVVIDYDKLGFRNVKAIQHNKGTKHLMHLVRLYLMGIDILNNKIIETYRGQDLALLKEIREGTSFYEEKDVPNQQFFDLVDDLRKRMDKALEETELPDKVNGEKIDRLLAEINSEFVIRTQMKNK